MFLLAFWDLRENEEDQSDDEKGTQCQCAVAHASSELFDQAIHQCPQNDRKLFKDVIKTEVGSMVVSFHRD